MTVRDIEVYGTPAHLVARALCEAEAMARYALAQGMAVPPNIISELTAIRKLLSPAERSGAGTAESAGARRLPALKNSFAPPPVTLPEGDVRDITKQLAGLHQELVRVVAPATPGTLLLLAEHKGQTGIAGLLGPVPLVRQMMFLALSFLVALLGMSTLDLINPEEIKKGFLENQGLSQLICQSFLLTAAGLGACFSALFEVNNYVGKGIYDPKYDASYWSRVVLGLMAGVVLAELLGPQFFQQDSGSSSTGAEFAKPTLAMLGGFSASLVHRILQRVVQSVESLVSGSAESSLKAKLETARARLEADTTEEKMKIATRLAAVRAQLGDNETASSLLEQLSVELLSPGRISPEFRRQESPNQSGGGTDVVPEVPLKTDARELRPGRSRYPLPEKATGA